MSGMGLFVGGAPVTAVYVGSTPVTAVYVGAEKIWPTTGGVVQITLGTGFQARDQLRAALTARGLGYTTVTEIPFDIELVGSGSTQRMFQFFSALTTVPDMDTSNVTSMNTMFYNCASLTHVPDMDTSSVTDVRYMLYGCAALTDGNVRLIGKHPNVITPYMIEGSGLTREPWYTADGKPIDVHRVTLTDVSGTGTVHPLLTVTVPAGETWQVRVQGTMQSSFMLSRDPLIRIGSSTSSGYKNGATVDYSGTITAANSTIALVTVEGSWSGSAGFTGTVTIEK